MLGSGVQLTAGSFGEWHGRAGECCSHPKHAAVVESLNASPAPPPVQIIPAENLVAAYQANPGAALLAVAPDCAAGRVMLEALEAGTDGVLLQTDSPAEVRGQVLHCCTESALRTESGNNRHAGVASRGNKPQACGACRSQPRSCCFAPCIHASRCERWRSMCSSGRWRADRSCSTRQPL